MQTTDLSMLWIIDFLIFSKKIKTKAEFANRIEMHPSTLTKIKNGHAHFTAEHIQAACHAFDINANFVIGLQKNVFNAPNSIENKEFISLKRIAK